METVAPPSRASTPFEEPHERWPGGHSRGVLGQAYDMSVGQLLDDVQAAIGTGLTPTPALFGGAEPVTDTDLPAVVLSLSEIVAGQSGLGTQLGGPVTGALPTTQTVDLADPLVVVPGGSVTLLSADRMTLLLPVGGLVRADGTTTVPWGPQDIQVSVAGTPVVVVMTTPAAGQVQLVATGQLVFPAPLPATGTVVASYYVGTWSLQAVSYQALLQLEVLATDPAVVDQLSRQLDVALGGSSVPELLTVSAVGWSAIAPPDTQRASARSRVLSYLINYERVDPVLPTASGPIVEIDAVFSPPLYDALAVPEGSSNE